MLFEEGFTQNREISWLRYNERVLEEALDETVPLFERLRFISIFVSNLEEFFRVRVGSLLGEDDEGSDGIDEKSGMTAAEQLRLIHSVVPGMLMKKDMALAEVEGKMAEAGIERIEPARLGDEGRGRCFDFFRYEIKDRLRVMLLDKDDPFPMLDEDRPYMIAALDAECEDRFGLIDIPKDIPQVFVLSAGTETTRAIDAPGAAPKTRTAEETKAAGKTGSGSRFRFEFNFDIDKDQISDPNPSSPRISSNSQTAATKQIPSNPASGFRYVLTEDIIKMFADTLFIPFVPLEVHTIDIARNADTSIPADANTAAEMRKAVRKRKYAPADKLIADGKLSRSLRKYLAESLGIDHRQIFTTTRIDFSYIDELEDLIPGNLHGSLFYRPHVPYDQTERLGDDIIKAARRKDILSAYPYDSMGAFLSLLREAAFADEVREIRLTIYRLASNPKITDYLIYAARNGRKVRVVLELRARFDEENNLAWADRLSAAGCRVYYGTDKYKVHSKMCQIVMDDGKGGKEYITQISTGNYNEKTAKKYTDLSMITADQKIGKAVSRLFKDICKERIDAKASGTAYAPLLAAPVSLRPGLLTLIKREADKGEEGRIFIKVNSLSDEEMIEALMEASCKGCRIRLIVRGICCMLPGVPNCTENVCIVNLVGRFLEHSRVYIFGEGNDELMYISSADLMTRNMDRRVEVACPVPDRVIRNRIRELMSDAWNDMDKGRVMLPDGTYTRK